jgi:uncharacterized glyoxalase superfamily protein PhnB
MTTPTSAGDNSQPGQESFDGQSLSVSLTVDDIRKSVAWYCDMLGFAIDQEFGPSDKPRAIWIKGGSVRILIDQDNWAKGRDRVKGAGFSLQLTTGRSVDEIVRRIRDAGGVLETEPVDVWGQRVLRLHDPDGYLLVISSGK